LALHRDFLASQGGIILSLAAVVVFACACLYVRNAELRRAAAAAASSERPRSRRGPRGVRAEWEGFDEDNFNDLARLNDPRNDASSDGGGGGCDGEGGTGGGGQNRSLEEWEVERALEHGPASGRRIYEMEMERVALGRGGDDAEDFGV
jgi:hypothetical protein